MYCIILLPNSAGRVPTAQELRLRGFAISTAVELPYPSLAEAAAPAQQDRNAKACSQVLALAAEEVVSYGAAQPPGI